MQKCFSSCASDCCNRDGIAVFFADVVVECLYADGERMDLLCQALEQDRGGGFKCVYLGPEGCLWRIKPIVCEMFLCDHAKETGLERNPLLKGRWEDLRSRERQFTWPDRPVLFDELEGMFLQAGHESPLMYFHRSRKTKRSARRAMPALSSPAGRRVPFLSCGSRLPCHFGEIVTPLRGQEGARGVQTVTTTP